MVSFTSLFVLSLYIFYVDVMSKHLTFQYSIQTLLYMTKKYVLKNSSFHFSTFFHSCVINPENEHTVLNKTAKSLDRLLAHVYHRSIGKGKKKPN